MDTKQLQLNNQREIKSLFHPSSFETPNSDVPMEKRTLMTVRKERGQRLTNEKVDSLVSPGSFNFTSNDKQISKRNGKYLFRTLYGDTLLTDMFFSETNIKNIQDLIRMIVFRETKKIIDNQSFTELLIIMRSIFLEYSAHPKLLDEKMTDKEKQELLIKYTNEVTRLNEIVINAVVPKIVSGMQQYLDYLRDASEQPYYMDKPEQTSIKGEREYRSVTQVLTGGEL